MALPRPPKDYYSLTEIAEEWEWSVADMLEYARQGKLELCVRFNRERATLREILYNVHDERMIRNDIRYTLLDGVYPILPRQLNEDVTWVEDCDEPLVDIENLYQDFETLKLEPFMDTFNPDDDHFGEVRYGYDLSSSCRFGMVITHKEKTRFESELENLTSGKPTVKEGIGTQIISDDVIGPKERKTWLKIIYLLATKLADANPAAYRKTNGSFNVSQFEDVLKNKAGDLLGTDDNINNSGHGLSNDNLKKIFDEAKTLF